MLLEKLKARLLAGIKIQMMMKNFMQLRPRGRRCRKQSASDKNTTNRREEAGDNR
jgi:hypothetical protein